jgi:hypothetical protein
VGEEAASVSEFCLILDFPLFLSTTIEPLKSIKLKLNELEL